MLIGSWLCSDSNLGFEVTSEEFVLEAMKAFDTLPRLVCSRLSRLQHHKTTLSFINVINSTCEVSFTMRPLSEKKVVRSMFDDDDLTSSLIHTEPSLHVGSDCSWRHVRSVTNMSG